jgi:hypothetical protein
MDEVETQEEYARAWLSRMLEIADTSLGHGPRPLLPEDAKLLKLGKQKAELAFEQLAKWFVQPLQEGSPSRATHGYTMLSDLMVGAFLIGSRGVHSETALNLIKLEKAPLVEGGQKGGKASGRRRQAKAEMRWKSQARAMIRDARRANPDWSQDNVVVEVIALWKGLKPPGRKSVTALVREMEKSGEIRRRET